MQENLAFQLAVHEACRRDPRFARNAYAFLCEVLQHTVKMTGRAAPPSDTPPGEEERNRVHVNGPELLSGWRDLAVLEFGPLANLVMREWGVSRSEDIGVMVFHFINIGYFGRSETDRLEDFSDGVDMTEALGRPFKKTCRPR
jgi:uncharacterized repeat protein (TIGR04138 family)